MGPVRDPRLRLALFALVLVAGAVLLTVTDVVTPGQLRQWVAGSGPLAPLVYVAVSALLGALLVPGPLLAATSGLLFGAGVGTLVTLAASVLSAVLALRVGRTVGRSGARELAGERAEAFEGLLARYGLAAVVLQRLAPGVPDAPVSYLAGAVGVRTWQIAAGTALGVLPRAFAYNALGASLGNPRSPLALAGLLAWVLATVAGAEALRRATRSARVQRGRRTPDG